MKKLCVITGLILAATVSQAALLAYEGFGGYADGTALDSTSFTNLIGVGTGWTNSPPGWTWSGGNQGAAHTTADGGLSYGDLNTTDGAIHWDVDTKKAGMYRNSTAEDMDDTAPGQSRWLSFIIKLNSGGESDIAVLNSYVGFNKTTGNATNSGAIDGVQLMSWDATAQTYTVAAKMNNNFDTNNLVTLSAGQTYLIVCELLDTTPDGDDTLNLFVNPTIGGALVDSPDGSITGPYIGDAGVVGQVAVSFSQNTLNVVIDEIRMGDTFEEVTPTTTVTNPPSTNAVAIISIDTFSEGVMELVVSGNATNAYPVATTNLVATTNAVVWSQVGHSTNGVAPFVITNLGYSAASGTNFVIYVEADTDTKFFDISTE